MNALGGSGLAALDDEAVLVIGAVGVNEGRLVVGVEEVFLVQRDIHVGQREVDFLGALRRNGEVSEDDIDLAGLQVLDAVGGLGGDVVDLYAEILGQTVSELDVVALLFAVLIDIAERVLVGENADVDGAVGLDLVQRAVNNVARVSAVAGVRQRR